MTTSEEISFIYLFVSTVVLNHHHESKFDWLVQDRTALRR